jgi:hypothetical protein
MQVSASNLILSPPKSVIQNKASSTSAPNNALRLQALVRPVGVAQDQVFLLSPARAGGPRYSMLVREGAEFDLARKLRQGSATIGEVYSFISGLYFRGKIAYVERFGAAPPGLPPALVMVPGAGLVPPDTIVTIEQMEAISEVPVAEDNRAFRDPLVNSAKLLKEHAGDCHYVLLGSVASAKYTNPLLEVFGERLLFPNDFVGRGDMSRGGLMLRQARSGIELPYVPVLGTRLHGSRPPKLGRRA